MQEEYAVILKPPVYDWIQTLSVEERRKIYAGLKLLSEYGPNLFRPYTDVIHGSKYPNLKELRISSRQSVLRIFYLFDPIQQAVILCGGNKKGKKEKIFYKRMIKVAENIYEQHIKQLNMEEK